MPSSGDIPDPGIEPRSALQADSFPSEPPGSKRSKRKEAKPGGRTATGSKGITLFNIIGS